MAATLVIGGQWGDEGKAKIVDSLAKRADYVVRFQGGANAGHTVVVGDKRFAFHLVPSGILYPHVNCVLGGGMVIDPVELVREIDTIRKQGISVEGRIFISAQAHVVLPYHVLIDKRAEERKGGDSIGSTCKGITPAYVDKVGREGIRMCDLLAEPEELEARLKRKLREKNRELDLAGFPRIPAKQTIQELLKASSSIRPMIKDTRLVLWRAMEEGKRILFEGAQGTLLDIDHGTYPYITSSSVTVGGAAIGAGVPLSAIGKVIGVFKAYCTRVGNGPFPTEEGGVLGDKLREVGMEYGTTTGRPRRCGWFDAVAARTAVKLNGMTEIALTKLDVLGDFPELKVCTSYRLGERRVDYLPVDGRELEKCKPSYEILEGWCERIGATDFADLPPRAKGYIEFLEDLLGRRIKMVSLGPERHSLIRRA